MARFRGFGLAAVFGLVIGVSACTTASPLSSAQAADAHRQAQAALSRWDAAVAATRGVPGFVLVGESTAMVGDDWGPKIDGGNAKTAWYAGLFVTASPLPADAPPDGNVTWPEGGSMTVPVMSAQQALAEMKAASAGPCPDCTPLEVTGATLKTSQFQTTRGVATVPAWEFSLKDTDVKLVHAAVGGPFVRPPEPTPDDQATPPLWTGLSVEAATLAPDGVTLTVGFGGAQGHGDKACGVDYTAEAVESDNAVVVIVYDHPNTTPVNCAGVGAWRTAQVTLARPFGSRTLIDLQAQPITMSRSSGPPAGP